MNYFDKSYLDFFKGLAKNNTTEWFNENRKAYENSVKTPFAAFVDEIIRRIHKLEPEVMIKPGDAIFRINKDVRFSKDKQPYNLHMSANISRYGKKDKSYPGFYFQLGYDKLMVIGGAYMIETATLLKMRAYISRNLKSFAAVYSDKEFKEHFGTLQGEKHLRLSEEFRETEKKEPLIANKQFYYAAQLDAKSCLKENFADELFAYYKAGRKMNQFLRESIK